MTLRGPALGNARSGGSLRTPTRPTSAGSRRPSTAGRQGPAAGRTVRAMN